jgi:hypothetical protein
MIHGCRHGGLDEPLGQHEGEAASQDRRLGKREHLAIRRQAVQAHRLLDDAILFRRFDRRRLGLHAQICKRGEAGHAVELRIARLLRGGRGHRAHPLPGRDADADDGRPPPPAPLCLGEDGTT